MRLLIAKLTSTSFQSVSVALNAASDVADLATDLDSCVRLLRSGPYDLILLITGNRRPDAREAIAQLRREVARLPLIALTEPEPTADAPPSDEQPCDEGPHPPASNGAGVLFSPPPPPDTLQLEGDMLRAGERTAGLSQAETRLFSRLWAARGEVVSAEDLLDAIYGEANRPVSRVLPVFLFKLRRKLALLGFKTLIETCVGRGFVIAPARTEKSAPRQTPAA